MENKTIIYLGWIIVFAGIFNFSIAIIIKNWHSSIGWFFATWFCIGLIGSKKGATE